MVALEQFSSGAPSPTPAVSLGMIGWLILAALVGVTWHSRRLRAPALSDSPVVSKLAPASLSVLYGGVFVVWLWA